MVGEIVFTPDQTLAINTEGCDVLVSAAAGSGKTAVLTRRVLNKIIDTSKKADITDFLVVTFTVAAASDLKKKLSDGIREEMKREGADISRLRRQLLSLSYAKIATIDSFCMFIVKDCLDELSLPVGMTPGDEKDMDALALEIMEEIIEEAFLKKSENEDFLLLVEAFSNARGDSALIPALIEIYKHILSYPEPLNLFDEYITECKDALLKKDKISFFKTPVGNILEKDIIEKTVQAENVIEKAIEISHTDEDTRTKYLVALEDDLKFISILKSCMENYSLFAEKLELFSPMSLPRITGRANDPVPEKVKMLRNTYKTIVSGLKADYQAKDEQKLFLQLETHIQILEQIKEIITEFHERFMSEKRRRKIMSFSDMNHFAIQALIEKGTYNRQTGDFVKTPYARTLTERFEEILIDEYQDVNELQDLVFRAISNSKNRFMVGDIKQSIYAFRGATPEIFEHYRDTFLPVDAENVPDDAPKTVFLQNNYRSDSNILDFSNRLFSRLMNIEKEKYLEKDKLVFSKNNDARLPVEVVMFDSNLKEDEETTSEALYIANRISSLVKSGEYKLSDIAVLARASSTLSLIKEALDSAGIASSGAKKENFFESFEVLTAISFLKAVANPTNDVYLASAMTSLPFSFTPDELLEIRGKAKKQDFYWAVLKTAEEQTPLSEKCRIFLDFIDALRDFASENKADRVLWRIIEKTNLFLNTEKLPDAKERRENLLVLYETARNICSYSENIGLSGLCDRFDTLARDGKFAGAKNAQEDKVHLMTFHGSKGLQFPVTFVAGLGKPINREDMKHKIIFAPFGPTFDLPLGKDNVKIASYLKKSAKRHVEKTLIEEELRNLYVTLTRAEKLLIVSAQINVNSIKSAIFNSSLSPDSFAFSVKHASTPIALLGAVLSEESIFKKALDSVTPVFSEENERIKVTLYKEAQPCDTVKTIEEKTYDKKEEPSFPLDFAMRKIEVSKLSKTPFKISVSRLKQGLLDDGETENVIPLASPSFISPDTQNEGALTGTAMHTFMQFCSFDIESVEDAKKEAKRLLEEGFITEDHLKRLDFEKLSHLFKSDVFSLIKKSPKVEREKRYTVLVKAKDLLKDESISERHSVLIQGVVDCYFENPDASVTLIDFKTDRVSEQTGEEVLINRHREQLVLYAEALEKILKKPIKKIYIYSFSLSRWIEVKKEI